MALNLSKSNFSQFPLVLIAPFFLWGTAMVAMKGVIPQTTPLFLGGLRLVPAGLLVLLFGLLSGRDRHISWQGWLWIGLFALVDGLMFQGFLAEGLVKTGAGLGSVMIDSQPLAVALLSSWLFGEVIGLWGWLGLGFGILGISLIGIPDAWILALFQGDLSFFQWENLGISGEVLMLGASLSMAVGTILIRYVSRHADPVMATGWHMILGGIPLFIASDQLETLQWQFISTSGWWALAYATIFGSAIAYGLFFYLASEGNLTSLSALTFLTPVFALIFGNVLLNEKLSPLQWVGVGLTLVSIYLINQREKIAAWFSQAEAAAGVGTPQDSKIPVESSKRN
ncbi:MULTISPECIES: DMT family transporter [Cyanophyceae]|uniref:DMT family transporter n=1 Tax=Cyanophyceae TaxID=3028117 RepID=UPI00016DCD9E|nr:MULTISPECIES: DMT family transporter [Cyanophyceae]ACB00516.1 permease of the drug/metabolite transporter [Picosynechococcus sp. PCC 7002]SMH50013.1 Permease of the drug/metabolite transporter (DMT) superfamily [Picosynechococcus sp. OG1]SMQ81718.1 Permease of the drug/metabolite transporter (DMT) superfamily [Synechococcus sp. 7002]